MKASIPSSSSPSNNSSSQSDLLTDLLKDGYSSSSSSISGPFKHGTASRHRVDSFDGRTASTDSLVMSNHVFRSSEWEILAPTEIQSMAMSHATTHPLSRRVRFSEGTAAPRQVKIAISIFKHEEQKEGGYTVYAILCWRAGRTWQVHHRYREFEALHKDLESAECIRRQSIQLPQLPKKRWFEKQRWLNKNDENYTVHRRLALEKYLRLVLRIPALLEAGPTMSVLDIFLEVSKHTKGIMSDFADANDTDTDRFVIGAEYTPPPLDDSIVQRSSMQNVLGPSIAPPMLDDLMALHAVSIEGSPPQRTGTLNRNRVRDSIMVFTSPTKNDQLASSLLSESPIKKK